MTNEAKQAIALLIINKGKKFNNSYAVVRVLEIFFRFSDFNYILSSIKDKKYISIVEVDNVNTYELTEKGKIFMESNRYSATQMAKKYCPASVNIIDSL